MSQVTTLSLHIGPQIISLHRPDATRPKSGSPVLYSLPSAGNRPHFYEAHFFLGFGCRSARNCCCHAAQQLPASTSATSSLRRLLQTFRWTSSSSKPLLYNPLTRVLIGHSAQRVSGLNDNQASSSLLPQEQLQLSFNPHLGFVTASASLHHTGLYNCTFKEREGARSESQMVQIHVARKINNVHIH